MRHVRALRDYLVRTIRLGLMDFVTEEEGSKYSEGNTKGRHAANLEKDMTWIRITLCVYLCFVVLEPLKVSGLNVPTWPGYVTASKKELTASAYFPRAPEGECCS